MNKLATALMILVATTSISFAANPNPDRDPASRLTVAVDSQTTASTSHEASLPRHLITKDNVQQPGTRLGERAPWAGN